MLARSFLTRVAGFLTVAVIVGCSSGPTGGPYATVSGAVTHNGTPVENAKVSFYSTVEKGGSFSVTTDSSGKYVLASYGKEPGVPPGMYKVTVIKYEIKGNLPADFDAGQMEASGQGKNAMPKDYESPATTKLSVTLDVGKNENKNFELKGTASNSKPVGP